MTTLKYITRRFQERNTFIFLYSPVYFGRALGFFLIIMVSGINLMQKPVKGLYSARLKPTDATSFIAQGLPNIYKEKHQRKRMAPALPEHIVRITDLCSIPCPQKTVRT